MTKRRKFRNSAQARLDRELRADWQDLLESHPVVKHISVNVPSKFPNYTIPKRNEHVNFVSRTHHGPATTGTSIEKPRYEGELLERELEALKEIEKKKKRVAIAYNKGAYQYITDDCDPKTIGKK